MISQNLQPFGLKEKNFENRRIHGFTFYYRCYTLDDGGLGARGEGVGKTALAAVLTVLVEGHL